MPVFVRELVGYRPHCSAAGLKRNPFWWAEAIWSREPVVFIRPEISKFRAGHTALVGKRKSRGEEGRGDLGRAASLQCLSRLVSGWVTEGFDTADLKEAKALLDERSRPLRL